MRPSPPQRGQATMFTIWPRIVCATRRFSPVPLHSGQVSGSLPGSPPAAVTDRAADERRELDLAGHAEDRIGELDAQVVPQVRAGLHTPAATSPGGRAPEERVEDVAERPKAAAESLVAAGAGAVDAGVPEHVVRLPALAIRQDAIRLVELLEALLRPVAGVDVGVMALRRTAEGALDLLVGGAALDAEHLVIVALDRHGAGEYTDWHSRTQSASQGSLAEPAAATAASHAGAPPAPRAL